MTEGICFFAYNNDQIDYGKLAVVAAAYTKKFLDKPVCLITDEGTWSWIQQSNDMAYIKRVIDDLVITDDEMKRNIRVHNVYIVLVMFYKYIFPVLTRIVR